MRCAIIDVRHLTFVLLPDTRTWSAVLCSPRERSPSSAGWPHPFPPASMYPESTTDSPARLSLRQTGSPGMIYRWVNNSVKNSSHKVKILFFIFFFVTFHFKFCVDTQTLTFHLWPLLLHYHSKEKCHNSEASWTEISQQHQLKHTVCVVSNALYSISSLPSMLNAFCHCLVTFSLLLSSLFHII